MRDFKTTLTKFVGRCQEVIDAHFVRRGYKWKRYAEIENSGNALIKVVFRDEHKSYGNAFCYIASKDGHDRQIGRYKKGDIFKAGRRGPEKTVQGNIFNADNGLGAIYRMKTPFLRSANK